MRKSLVESRVFVLLSAVQICRARRSRPTEEEDEEEIEVDEEEIEVDEEEIALYERVSASLTPQERSDRFNAIMKRGCKCANGDSDCNGRPVVRQAGPNL